MKNILKKLKRVNGQSLAEFAVTTAMMATLATTAAPKFSGVGESAKEKKTLSDIDKILKAANNFYNTEVTDAGRGRFPGQSKFNQNVPEGGGYVSSDIELELQNDLTGDDANFNNYASFTLNVTCFLLLLPKTEVELEHDNLVTDNKVRRGRLHFVLLPSILNGKVNKPTLAVQGVVTS